MKLLAERLKLIREKLGKSQLSVAKEIHIKNTTLSNYELNISSPPPETLATLARYYNVSTDYLLGLTATAQRDFSLTQEDIVLVYALKSLNTEERKTVQKMITLLQTAKNKQTES